MNYNKLKNTTPVLENFDNSLHVLLLLRNFIQESWLCRRQCDPRYHAYDFISINLVKLYTKLDRALLLYKDYLVNLKSAKYTS